MFSFFCLGCETPSSFRSLFHCVSLSCVHCWWGPLTLKRLPDSHWRGFSSQTCAHLHAHIHSVLFFSLPPHKPLSQLIPLFFVPNLLVTSLHSPTKLSWSRYQEEVSEDTSLSRGGKGEEVEGVYRGRYPLFRSQLSVLFLQSYLLYLSL